MLIAAAVLFWFLHSRSAIASPVHVPPCGRVYHGIALSYAKAF
jgi:hypothetical protein